jgi:predicted PurR-regulated permease PerM
MGAGEMLPDSARSRATWFTPDRVIRLAVALVVGALAYWLFLAFRDLVLLLLIGFILGYVLNPVVDWFQQFGMSRLLAATVTFVLVLAGLGFVLAYLIPFVGQQATELAALLDRESWARVTESIEDAIGAYLPLAPGTLSTTLQDAFDALFEEDRLSEGFGYALGLFTNIVYAIMVVPFTMFFMMKDGRIFRDDLMRLVPNRYLELTVDLVDKIESNIGAYLRALFIRAIYVSIIASIGLWFVDLDYALAVGIFTGIANTIPYFGPVIGGLGGIIVGIAQTGDLSLLLGILIVMLVLQFLDNVVFQPLVFSRAADSHPIVVLVAVLIGAELGGILGMLLAVPVLAIAKVTVNQILWSIRRYHIFRSAQ